MVFRLCTGPEDQGQRLDQFLQTQLADFSRGQLRKIIDLGGVHVAGRRVRKCGYTLVSDLAIEVHRDQAPLDPYRIVSSDVLYQDDFLIALNKPAGVETQPTPARYKGTLYEALQLWLGRDRRFGRKLEIGMLQRLDRDTSGVILFSIHPRSHKPMTQQMTGRVARKRYLALVAGCPEPEAGEYHSFLAKDRRTNRMKSVPAGGKEAITRYRVVRTLDQTSLVDIDLVTGRTHQIRAHFSEAGHPLLGDTRYGGSDRACGRAFTRQCLHSWRLGLTHPISGEPLKLEAPLPPDMQLDSADFETPLAKEYVGCWHSPNSIR